MERTRKTAHLGWAVFCCLFLSKDIYYIWSIMTLIVYSYIQHMKMPNLGFGKIGEIFSGEGDFKNEAENFVRNWAIKRGRATPENFKQWFSEYIKTAEWATILSEAKADNYDGYVRENEGVTGFAYKNSKDSRIPSGGGGGITTPWA